jgi:hypothetical protein
MRHVRRPARRYDFRNARVSSSEPFRLDASRVAHGATTSAAFDPFDPMVLDLSQRGAGLIRLLGNDVNDVEWVRKFVSNFHLPIQTGPQFARCGERSAWLNAMVRFPLAGRL